MQFLVYGIDPHPHATAVPSAEQMAEMAQFIQEAVAAEVVIATGGLTPTGTRIHLCGETLTVTDGPFIEAKELIAGFAVIEVPSKEEALAWAKRFRAIIGEGETEIVQIVGPQ